MRRLYEDDGATVSAQPATHEGVFERGRVMCGVKYHRR